MKKNIALRIKQSIGVEPINAVARNSGLSKTIIYKILKSENYEINSLVKLCQFLRIELTIK